MTNSNSTNTSTSNAIINKLKTEFILVSCTTKKGRQKIKDKAATTKLAQREGADEGSFEVNKKIWAGDEAIGEIYKLVNQASAYHTRNTTPFGEMKGARLLPSMSLTKTYIPWMQNQIALLDTAIRDVESSYDYRVQLAITKSATMADASLFPTYDEFVAGTTVSYKYMPVPLNTNYNQINLPASFAKECAEAGEAQAAEDAKNIVNNALKKVILPLESMIKATRATTSGRKPAVFDSMVTNLEQATDMVQSFNLYNDPAISQFVADVRKHLLNNTVEEIKHSETVQTTLHTKSNELLDTLDDLGF